MLEKKGFTLIELLAVMTILGFVVLLAVPSTINVMEKNKKDSILHIRINYIQIIPFFKGFFYYEAIFKKKLIYLSRYGFKNWPV